MPPLSVPDLTTLTGLLAITLVTVEMIKRVWQPTSAALNRFGALIAVSVGCAWSEIARIVAGPVTGDTLLTALLSGIVVGAASAGIYDVATSASAPSAPTTGG